MTVIFSPAPKPRKRRKRQTARLNRSGHMARTPMKKTNRKRRVSEFARCYHSQGRVEWVKAQPCVVSGYTPCDNAHIEGDGAGRKAAFDKIVPLARKHHRELHKGRAAFEKKYDVDLDALAALTELAWRAVSPEREPSNG
jgi:hypothetical protein